MCSGIYFDIDGQDAQYLFDNPRAVLPVIMSDGTVSFVPWGRRNNQEGRLPLGGWAWLHDVYAGRWNRYFPKPVKIAAKAFMEYRYDKIPKWHTIVKDQYIQGLVALHKEEGVSEQRLYVVLIEPGIEDQEYPRWPKIVNGG
jgi:hypothetical protein